SADLLSRILEKAVCWPLGGKPNVHHDGDFVTVPIQPIVEGIYAYYAIVVDGFDITPPSPSAATPILSSPTRPQTSSRLHDPYYHPWLNRRQLVVPQIDPANYTTTMAI